VFEAAAHTFSAKGFAGALVDDIARDAGVNKAMIYYHFSSKLALYRAVVRDMLASAGDTVIAIAESAAPPTDRLEQFIAAFVRMADERPWFPPLMLREVSEGAPRLDAGTLSLMRVVFGAFHRILADGQRQQEFRAVNPVLAYLSVLGPLMMNAARERAGNRPGRRQIPIFAEVSHVELTDHLQQSALRMLRSEQ
jgi:AcrR family transcriptional regulator